MADQRPCKWCNNEFEEHLPFGDYGNFVFCPNQFDLALEILDIYEPYDNLQYLESLYNKKISKEIISK